MNPTILGVIGPGFLNQVPTLHYSSGFLSQSLKTKRPLEEMALYPFTINPYMVYEP